MRNAGLMRGVASPPPVSSSSSSVTAAPDSTHPIFVKPTPRHLPAAIPTSQKIAFPSSSSSSSASAATAYPRPTYINAPSGHASPTKSLHFRRPSLNHLPPRRSADHVRPTTTPPETAFSFMLSHLRPSSTSPRPVVERSTSSPGVPKHVTGGRSDGVLRDGHRHLGVRGGVLCLF
ncbi:hypothetical protein BC829DRAFT_119304 [Chytridium lagenaria]|nr:hypothetical protein BC829DRAFT_119304 [Chytridium lagenaria]